MRRAENFGSPAGNISLGSSYTSKNNSGIGKFLGNVILGILGLVVLAFANGGPEVFNNLFDALLTPSVSMGEDPKNYYGQYFGSVNSVGIVSIEIDSQEITITAMSGISVETNTYSYDYVSADYAQSRVNAANFGGYDDIFVYQTSDQEMILPF